MSALHLLVAIGWSRAAPAEPESAFTMLAAAAVSIVLWAFLMSWVDQKMRQRAAAGGGARGEEAEEAASRATVLPFRDKRRISG